MAEAARICALAAAALSRHADHPQARLIGEPGVQGVEAVLAVLRDRCGFQHPGGAFLGAVDVLLGRQAVVQQVLELLERCAAGACEGCAVVSMRQAADGMPCGW